MKCRIGLNAGGDLAAIRFRHCDIEGDRVRLKILRSLMTFAWVVLFPAKIAASRFQSALGRVGKVAVVIDYQDAWLLELSAASGEKFASIVLLMIFHDILLRPFLNRSGCQRAARTEMR